MGARARWKSASFYPLSPFHRLFRPPPRVPSLDDLPVQVIPPARDHVWILLSWHIEDVGKTPIVEIHLRRRYDELDTWHKVCTTNPLAPGPGRCLEFGAADSAQTHLLITHGPESTVDRNPERIGIDD